MLSFNYSSGSWLIIFIDISVLKIYITLKLQRPKPIWNCERQAYFNSTTKINTKKSKPKNLNENHTKTPKTTKESHNSRSVVKTSYHLIPNPTTVDEFRCLR